MKKQVLVLTALFLASTPPAYAQRVSQLPASATDFASLAAAQHETREHNSEPLASGIVAVVNESIISSADLKARLKLAVMSAGMPDSPEVQKKLLPQVLRGLIDEQLQLQEGKKQNISVTAEDVSRAMQRLAEDNKIPGGNMASFLRSNGIPPATLQTQIKSTLIWNKIIMHQVRPRIDIGDDEIDTVIQRMRANAGKQEYLMSEIFLAVDKPEEEEQVKALAEKLVEQVKAGTAFGAAARQFSQGLGAANGGDIGWIQVGQLAPEIDKVLPNLDKGSIAGPIRSAGGYHLLGVRDKRTIALGDAKDLSIKLEQVFRPFSSATEKDALLHEAEALRQTITSCASIQSTVASKFPLWRYQDLGDVKIDKAPPWLANKVINLAEGQSTEAMATDKGALIVFVCGRSASENINREAIRNAIGTEKMELMARRLLRDLRKSAYLDIRIK